MNHLKAANRILGRFYRRPQDNLKLLLSRGLAGEEDGESRFAVTRTVYGAVREDRVLNYIVGRFSRKSVEKIDPESLTLIKIGVFLLLFSRSYPDYAVVNEVVGLSKDRAKGFVNGVLRNIARGRERVKTLLEEIGDPSVKYSISPLLVQELDRISDGLEGDLDYLNTEPVFHIRLPQGTDEAKKLREYLAGHRIEYRELEKFDSLELGRPGQIPRRFLGERQGYFQNTASQFVAILAAGFADRRVLDCCAAPGTKSVTLNRLNPDLAIYANDINLGRLRLLKDILPRENLRAVHPVVSDTAVPAFKNRFHLVMADLPCTSSGTLRKNPDLKLKIDQDLVQKKSRNQAKILESIVRHFPRAYVLYSVCSFLEAETDGILSPVLGSKTREIEDLSGILDRYGFNYKRGEYGFYLLPHRDLNNDVFYLSLFKA